jgi:nitrogen fixation/metabolism regulation signal transduction histidine kinase
MMTEFSREVEAHDRNLAEQQASLIRRQHNMIVSLVGGLALMVVLIGLLGIYFTHKVSGPVHKMKGLLRKVGTGDLHVDARLRKGDELQDFFEAFTEMVASLRAFEGEQLGQIENALGAMERGEGPDAITALRRVRDAMRTGLHLD